MAYDQLRYNDVRQKSSHNAFQRREGIYDQMTYWRIRSIELDLHRSKPLRGRLQNDWYVYHLAVVDPDTTVDTLSGVLDICRGIQRATPNHEVITLFLDIRDAFHTTQTASQSAQALDRLLLESLGEAHVLRPEHLIARAPGSSTLQEAVTAAGWPTLASLRGKFVVVLTGPPALLETYANAVSANARVAFLSVRVSRVREVPGPPHIVFYNMDGGNVAPAAAVHEQGFVSRAYRVNSESRWNNAVARNCHHLATDFVNSREATWARTRNGMGFPFQVLDSPTPDVVEDGEVCGIWARSGDIWDTSDGFMFHYRECPPGERDNRYVFYIGNPNSDVEDFAKGCVMARAGLQQGAPYLGVFRIAEHHGLRVQYRVSLGGTTVSLERPIEPVDVHDPDTLVFVRLNVSQAGKAVRAWGSVDGRNWTELGAYEFDSPLAFQGIGVSGNGQDRGVKMLFGVPGDGPRPPFNRYRFIGKSAPDERGWVDWDGTRRWRVGDFEAD